MRLTVYTDYALRVLMYAALHPERLCTIAEISAAYGISKNHVMKVVYELRVAGYIETIRGQQGGFRLARPPQAILLGEVVRRTEPETTVVPCLQAPAYCAITPACKLKQVLQQASNAFFEVLDGCTLADLAVNADVLAELLAQNRPPSSARGARALPAD